MLAASQAMPWEERPRSSRTGVDECSLLHESTEDYGAQRSERDPYDGDL